jgi:pimeloyl-ACP methyl ester carboxylesterase
MYAQLFAAKHPNEIAGLLFLDPRTAEFQTGYRDTLTPDERAADEADNNQAIQNETFGAEIAGADESAAQVAAAGPLPRVPLVVLTAGQSGLDSATGTAFWRATHDHLAAQVPGGTNTVIDGAEHEIWRTNQEEVVDAVKKVSGG